MTINIILYVLGMENPMSSCAVEVHYCTYFEVTVSSILEIILGDILLGNLDTKMLCDASQYIRKKSPNDYAVIYILIQPCTTALLLYACTFGFTPN